MYELCIEHGIPAPRTSFPNSGEEAVALAAELGYPCVVKALDAGLAHRHGRPSKVVIVESPQELIATFEELKTPEGANVLVQEHIPGEPRDVWMFNGYFDAQSRCLFGQVGRKLRQHPPYTGMTTLGSVEANETVRAMTIELMRAIDYRGILDLGFRYDHSDGQFKLLDVNPRIGGTFRLFVDQNGLDCARVLYMDMTGQTVRTAEPRRGRRWLVENFDTKSSYAYMKDGRLSGLQWLKSFRHVEETAWFATDDLAPFLKMCRKFFLPLPGRATRQGAAAPVRQQAIADFFETDGRYWAEVYDAGDHQADIYRRRRDRVVSWASYVAGESPGKLLDVGCGAGVTALPLAERGWEVVAVDPAESMVAETKRRAADAGMNGRLVVEVGDAHDLSFDDRSFDLVVAVGVLPWLHSPAVALAELWRVLRPNGYLLITSDNRARLTKLLHPMYNPIFAAPRRWAKAALTRAGYIHDDPTAVWPRMYYPGQTRRLLRQSGFTTLKERTLGFGPLTAFGRPLTGVAGRRIDERLQGLADEQTPGVRSLGAHHVILARKNGAQAPDASSS
jgi:ubiquinone/menaquinone biosynthesis C-methylase UbiE